MEKERLFALDYMRGLASLFVVYAHLITVASKDPNAPSRVLHSNIEGPLYKSFTMFDFIDKFAREIFFSQLGEIGVFIFFLISGFLIPLLFERYNKRSFLVNRFFRLYPTHIIVLFFSIFLIYLSTLIYGGTLSEFTPKSPPYSG